MSSTQLLNTSLESIESIIVLDIDGNRLLSRYFPSSSTKYPTSSSQSQYESSLFKKTKHQLSAEILALKNTFVLFRQHSDLIFYLTACEGENELFLSSMLDSFIAVLNGGSLAGISKGLLDKRSFLNAYDMVNLTLDEFVERGVVMEVDEEMIEGSVDAMRKSTLSGASSILENISQEKSISGAFSAAKDQIAKRFFGF